MSNTVLVFDLYYLDEAARVGLANKKVKFIGAIKTQRFPSLAQLVRDGVTRKGQWWGLGMECEGSLLSIPIPKQVNSTLH